jgi:hypothetical protein
VFVHAPLVCIFWQPWISSLYVSIIIMSVPCDCLIFYTFTGAVCAAICRKARVMFWTWGSMCQCMCHPYVSYLSWVHKYDSFPRCPVRTIFIVSVMASYVYPVFSTWFENPKLLLLLLTAYVFSKTNSCLMMAR